MDSVRLVQCSAPRCGVPFFLCPDCDRGQTYCERCRPGVRRHVRKASRCRYWRSRKGRRKTAARVSAHRRRRQNVTHAGRREVGPPPIVDAPSATVAIKAIPTAGVETTDGIDLDGNRTQRDEHTSARDGGRARHVLEGEAAPVARAPACGGVAARGDRPLAGQADPRCALCDDTHGGFASTFFQETFGGAATPLYTVDWIPGPARVRRAVRRDITGMGDFADLRRLLIEEVAR